MAFIIGIAVGAAGGGDTSSDDAGAQPAPTVTETETETVTLDPTTAQQAEFDKQSKSLDERESDLDAREKELDKREKSLDKTEASLEKNTIPGDGTYLVGEDIKAGTYISNDNSGCYWARLSGTGGDLGDIIANGNEEGRAIVTIKASDEAFETSGCADWHKK
ncbi:hypothetical protein [Cellulomonas sp. PhB150]|uniref:hypothetical protein n=1 Tax=Cellulomonas sp. PhB150 TaxID=2485188 RepID=UPI000F990F7D|nr:hypothetical protein [Cellulomonas sp. PhB150]ROS21811.1 hypothetical protein EDF34_3458 [Cellulomonas sp. PhB150]